MCLLWLGSRLLNYWMWVTGEVWPTSVYLWRHMFWPLSDVTCSIGYLPKGCFVCVCVYIVFPCGENHLIRVVTWLPKIDIIATCHGPRVCACSCCGCDCCLCCFFYATHDSCVCDQLLRLSKQQQQHSIVCASRLAPSLPLLRATGTER